MGDSLFDSLAQEVEHDEAHPVDTLVWHRGFFLDGGELGKRRLGFRCPRKNGGREGATEPGARGRVGMGSWGGGLLKLLVAQQARRRGGAWQHHGGTAARAGDGGERDA